ncbi:SLU7 (YDR088C) [Zygosaccharomyces parabailii]|uniref:Pre-mRNA-splicing factor SLU7 n=1 Tax=Zygosaccharomyces bailii (strain CLIB 213 / ATCC 58445 / CBS 680 / BCRC 21525 / NBRC 1098 / NCYC 1416 / NRRL Y-2227) TaxID=1333698 RepID=A0A8J2X7C0_ZYGB2|nr:SLU7 (YDR088C) [Zygosaccharomyces parabailii]CDF88511.1 BN860_11958g1_1 [Zygosaccharomyces bailii CLIB 213]CDH14610.1 related to Pre-mRNA-splicing factor SLU7 [Zygosaccharomyces bailii ISA1307]SJM82237.1 related to Pre-mRNA-splicing factor SLU7 [Zygosaccharomyces bailii]
MSEKARENVHIPRYIKNQPWYFKEAAANDEDYLAHHRQSNKGALDIENNAEPKIGLGIKDEFETVQVRKVKANPTCLNCGSPDHTRRDCLERPRKSLKGSSEEVVIKRKLHADADWDAKQDRWFGYTGKEYNKVLQEWSIRDQKGVKEKEEEWDTDEEIELMKLGLFKDAVGHLKQDDAKNTQLKASVRLREDKAAYLNDLNTDELKYDPKSRLYKSEELGSVDEESHMFHRHLTGEAKELRELARLGREHAVRMGVRDDIESDIKARHVLVANPTKYEMMKERKRSPGSLEGNIVPSEAQKSSGTVRNKQDLQDLYG